MIWLFLVLLLVLAISVWDGFAAGVMWRDSKAMGGWTHWVTRSALVMSVCGFFEVWAIVLALVSASAGWINHQQVQAIVGLVYFLVIVPILGFGTIIWLDSVVKAYRERSAANIATAAYNTFAMADNVVSVAENAGGIFDGLKNFFSKDDDDEDQGVVLLIVLLAAIIGIGCTYLCFAAGLRSAPVRVNNRSRPAYQ